MNFRGVCCLIVWIAGMFSAEFALAQSKTGPVDSLEILQLDAPEVEMDGIGDWKMGIDGSGEGEEPPGFVGFWWSDAEPHGKAHKVSNNRPYDPKVEQATSLELESINGGKMPTWIGKCRKLKHLTITYANEAPLPAGIWTLPQLESLELTLWSDATIGPGIGGLRALKSLQIHGIVEGLDLQLAPEIGRLSSLERISIHGIKIAHLPTTIFNLTKLHYLRLEGQEIPHLPAEIGRLQLLDTLILQSDGMQSLPATFGNLQRLRYLDISNNHLNSLPATFCNLQALQSADLRQNALIDLPPDFGRLTALEALNVELNQLTGLPASFGRLGRLWFLDLSSNHISMLPLEFGNLQSLRSLTLSENKLSSLPSSFGNLHQLGSLNLNDNRMTDLPNEFVHLDSLQLLQIDKLHLLHLPPDVWVFINKFGTKIHAVPTEIAGKPLAYYLNHPAIDAYSKRYVQGDLAISSFFHFDPQIRDSLLTRNPETAPFYLFLFANYHGPKDENSDSWVTLRQFFGSEEISAQYILQQPCEFISQVMDGPYKVLYQKWLKGARYLVRRGFSKNSDLYRFLQAKMHAVCGDQCDRKLLEMIKDMAQW